MRLLKCLSFWNMWPSGDNCVYRCSGLAAWFCMSFHFPQILWPSVTFGLPLKARVREVRAGDWWSLSIQPADNMGITLAVSHSLVLPPSSLKSTNANSSFLICCCLWDAAQAAWALLQSCLWKKAASALGRRKNTKWDLIPPTPLMVNGAHIWSSGIYR